MIREAKGLVLPEGKPFDVAVIGGGIVGLATALSLQQRGWRSIAVLEAEERIGVHQTGHNSGVIHAGLYYRPGSLKARLCVAGRDSLYQLCRERGVPHERCGKLIVATRPSELRALAELEERGRANGVTSLRRCSAEELREVEPHAAGVAALHVGDTGIVDFAAVAVALAQLISEQGGAVRTRSAVIDARMGRDGFVLLTTRGDVFSRNIVNCGGLHSDRLARLFGVDPKLQIVPFRGEYFHLRPARRHLVRSLIYPVPDPALPFLGVHLTRTITGAVEAGPNAVLALSRHGYRWSGVSGRDVTDMVTYGGFWRMAKRHWKIGLAEAYRSLNRRAAARSLRALLPELTADDLLPAGAGVRAQAVDPDGTLVNDFRVVEGLGMLHVLNAPSPAATAALAIGIHLCDLASHAFRSPTRARVS